jgi:hypothetical protein
MGAFGIFPHFCSAVRTRERNTAEQTSAFFAFFIGSVPPAFAGGGVSLSFPAR